MTTTNTSQILILCSLYAFENLKSSSTWFNPCFPLRRAYLLRYVESVYLLLSILEANTCVNFVCIDSYMFTYCTCYIALCWQLSMRYTCYKLKAIAETLSSFVLLQCLLLWIYCFMSYLLCKTFWCLSWKYYSWKVFAYMIHCLLVIYLLANYRSLLWVTSFMTWALQYIDQDCVKACLLRNYLLLSFYLLVDE